MKNVSLGGLPESKSDRWQAREAPGRERGAKMNECRCEPALRLITLTRNSHYTPIYWYCIHASRSSLKSYVQSVS